MEIEVLEFEEGARKAKGVVVIIDVFRAFSVACYVFDSGAEEVIATADVDMAFALKRNYKNSVLVGEREERKIEGFDFGNSPSEIIRADLKGKTVIHTTTAGTNGLVNAVNADTLITGSIVNAGAVVGYIKTLNTRHVSLVAMGYRAKVSADEDLLCAEIIAEGLKGNDITPADRISGLRNTSGSRFFNQDNYDFSPPEDFFLCTAYDRFNFVLKALPLGDGSVRLSRIDLHTQGYDFRS